MHALQDVEKVVDNISTADIKGKVSCSRMQRCLAQLLVAVAVLGFNLVVIMSAGCVLPVLAVRNLPDVQRSSRQGDSKATTLALTAPTVHPCMMRAD